MSIERVTSYGNINISQEAIATLAGGVVSECYGVVGMASQKLVKDGWAELLKKENYSRGVVVRKTDKGMELDPVSYTHLRVVDASLWRGKNNLQRRDL